MSDATITKECEKFYRIEYRGFSGQIRSTYLSKKDQDELCDEFTECIEEYLSFVRRVNNWKLRQ